MSVARADEMGERFQEGGPLPRLQGVDRTLMGSARRLFHLLEQGLARRRRQDALQSPIFLAGQTPNQPALGQTGHDIGERCAVDTDFLRKGRLLKARLASDRRENAVLDGRDVEGCALFGEQREVNLMQAPDQKSRTGRQRKGLLGTHAS